MEEYDLTILLIAYNEENFLENCVEKVIQAVTPLDLKYEIVIVENGTLFSFFAYFLSLLWYRTIS